MWTDRNFNSTCAYWKINICECFSARRKRFHTFRGKLHLNWQNSAIIFISFINTDFNLCIPFEFSYELFKNLETLCIYVHSDQWYIVYSCIQRLHFSLAPPFIITVGRIFEYVNEKVDIFQSSQLANIFRHVAVA